MIKILRAILITSFFVLSGCSGWHYFEIESNFQIQPSEDAVYVDVTESKEYRNYISSVETIAVSAPAYCIDETHSQSSGRNRNTDTLLKSACGVEMAYIERALISEGYRVISWKVVDNRVFAHRSSPLEVAKSLNADLLLVVQSLERSVQTGYVTEWDRRYYIADKHGNRLKPIPLHKSRRIREAADNVQRYEREHWSLAEYPSVNLSVTATSTESGEAIWFYDKTTPLTDKSRTSGSYITEWACDRTGDCKPWGSSIRRKEMKLNPDNYMIFATAPKEMRDRTDHSELIKRVVGEMVIHLKTGEGI